MTQSELDEYISHWENMYRIIEETAQGITRPRWKTIQDRPDHYAHATVYWRIALEQTLSEGDIVEPGVTVNVRREEEHPFIYSNHTMDSLDLDDILEKMDNKGWKYKTR